MARIVQFVDGASSETTPTIGNIVASDLTTYVDDAAYEAANAGAPTDGNLYFNTNLNVIRYYDGTAWNTIQSTSEKDQANGYAGLDGSGKLSASTIPDSFVEFKGVWNATTNTPALIDGTGNTGDVYRTSVAGTQDLGSGSEDYDIGDWVTYSGTIWEKSDFTGGGNFWSDPVDADIVPDSANARDLGELMTPFEQSFVDNIFVTNGGSSINGSLTTGNNNLLVNSFRVRTEINLPITLQTANDSADDSVKTSDVYILSGNKTAGDGDSGDIVNQTGTSASGERGSIVHKDGSESGAGAGAVWTQAAADGVGKWSAPAGGATTENVNLDIIGGGEWSFNGTNLVNSEDAFIQHAPFLDDRNTILAQSIAIADGEVAYVDVNKTSDSTTNLTVNTAAISSYVASDDRFIIARRDDGSEIEITASQLVVDAAASIMVQNANGAHRSQEFIASKTGLITEIRLKQGRLVGLGGDYSLDIRTDDGGGKPSLTILDSVDFDAAALPLIATLPLGSFQSYPMNTAAAVVEGISYHLVWSNVSLTGASSDRIDIEYTTTGSIPGSFRTSTDNGTTWSSDFTTVDVHLEIDVLASGPGNVQIGKKLKLSDGDSAKITQGITVNKYQTKILIADVITNTTVSDLTFNNLVVGKNYEVTGSITARLDVAAAGASFGFTAEHDGATINNSGITIEESSDTVDDVIHVPVAFKFTASATTLTFVTTSLSANAQLDGDGTRNETYIQLEERNNLVVTTDFT